MKGAKLSHKLSPTYEHDNQIIVRPFSYLHRGKIALSVWKGRMSGAPLVVSLNSISVFPVAKVFQKGVMFSGSGVVFGLRDVTMARKDSPNDVTKFGLL